MPYLSNFESTGTQAGDAPGIISLLGDLMGGLLGSLLGNGGIDPQVQDAIDQATGFDFYNTMLGEQFLGGAVNAVADVLRKTIGAIGAAVTWINNTLIAQYLAKLINEILKLIHYLRNLLAPLIKWLQQLQKIQRAYQLQWMRTMTDIIQRIRKILVPLRLLHVRWAKKLDSDLAGIETDLGTKLAKLVARQNEIRNVLNLILDPSLILRPGQALAGAGTMIGAVHQAIGALSWQSLLCAEAPTTPMPLVEPWAQTQQRITTEMRTSTGDYAVYQAQRNLALTAFAFDLGVTPLV